ncbi:MAG TPA: triphosphoribosyl-dephospho-CoA synthase MdcB [Casimicrobiaceae bacterium]|jgi:triphosphoribosyl-dephospho-CoA synthase|nr:triphosphoribosyl-dephospho-CoA synthase MdcB [Casimicrobiaceae bacterium]
MRLSLLPLTERGESQRHALAHSIARCAVASLHAELVLHPKPGMVGPRDSGAHTDMDAMTFMRSLFALRHYFVATARAGTRRASFAELRALGLAAEARMLAATAGVNTHRGAIFALGLLSAAIARVRASGRTVTDARLQQALRLWRGGLIAAEAGRPGEPSHGRMVAMRYRTGGARAEALLGFPAVFEIALPALRQALERGADPQRAQVQALFALLAQVADTNVLYRGGTVALAYVQRTANDFLAQGGVFDRRWPQRAEAMHRQCCALRLSPGGCADLLSASLFVHRVQTCAQ